MPSNPNPVTNIDDVYVDYVDTLADDDHIYVVKQTDATTVKTLKHKYSALKALFQTYFDTRYLQITNLLAANVSIADNEGNFTATDVEEALVELLPGGLAGNAGFLPLTADQLVSESKVLYDELPVSMESSPVVAFGKGSGLTGVPPVSAGGSGYAVGDIITLDETNALVPAKVKVATESAGVITSVSLWVQGIYTTTPANPVAQASTDGAGTGATFTCTWNSTTGGSVEWPILYGTPTDTTEVTFTGVTPLTNLGGSGYYGSASNGHQSAFEWSTDSKNLTIIMAGLSTKAVLYVDGKLTSLTEKFDTDASGSRYYLAVEFLTVKWRTFKLLAINQGVSSIYLNGVATVKAPIKVQAPFAWCLGDSYNAGSGAFSQGTTPMQTMCSILGIDLVADGIGGTGWNSTSTSAPDYRAGLRLTTLSRTPDYIFLDLGYNDAGGNMTTAAAAFDATMAEISTYAPDAKVICFGPATPLGSTVNLNLVRDMLIARCAFHGIDFIDVQDWVDANNEVLYTNVDNVHPSEIGARFLGALRADSVKRLRHPAL